MTIRDKRQAEFADIWWEYQWGILNLCPRFGKIYTSINILEKFKTPPTILIAYPDRNIKKSWKEDFKKRGYDDVNVTYTTHLSIKKYTDEKFDLIIIDEIHLLSDAQIIACQLLFSKNDKVLGLTGTLSHWTEKALYEELQLPVIAQYTIKQAVDEKVLPDYEITVISVPLDKKTRRRFKKRFTTEFAEFGVLTRLIQRGEIRGKDVKFHRFARMRVIQSSLAKRDKTIELLEKHKNERVLVFCGMTSIADDLGIPSHHSKSSDKDTLTKFASGEGNHLAVVKIGNTGVTYKPLNRVIINYFDSNAENMAQKINRCMSMEYDNLDKKAKIYIITTTEDVEKRWLRKALEFFDKTKIKYYG